MRLSRHFKEQCALTKRTFIESMKYYWRYYVGDFAFIVRPLGVTMMLAVVFAVCLHYGNFQSPLSNNVRRMTTSDDGSSDAATTTMLYFLYDEFKYAKGVLSCTLQLSFDTPLIAQGKHQIWGVPIDLRDTPKSEVQVLILEAYNSITVEREDDRDEKQVNLFTNSVRLSWRSPGRGNWHKRMSRIIEDASIEPVWKTIIIGGKLSKSKVGWHAEDLQRIREPRSVDGATPGSVDEKKVDGATPGSDDDDGSGDDDLPIVGEGV